jgi:photosystem II stability/assembly factor-like uncharacterized protein
MSAHIGAFAGALVLAQAMDNLISTCGLVKAGRPVKRDLRAEPNLAAVAAIVVIATAVAINLPAYADARAAPPAPTSQSTGSYDASLFKALHFRQLGPFRGGRSTAVTGVADQPFTFYMGSSGGGVFKTADAGMSWHNVSDGFFAAGSIGAIAVAPSDASVVYVGTGSACPRGNVSPGIGMYRSTDAGATWKHIGLDDAGQIARLAVHPTDARIVYVATLGHIFGRNEQRGVFRSRDGGESWQKVLYLNDTTGAVDIKMDPANPSVIYAAFWHAERKPWTIESGGAVGGIYKSGDGGDTWRKLTNGLPQGMTGRIGIAVSPARPQRVWAIIEGERIASGFKRDEFGMYRSDDAGGSWSHLSADPKLHQRPWYFHHLIADPKDENILYHLGDEFWRSTDGGVTFKGMDLPHVDQHDLWINPRNPQIMVAANDGGGTVTLNGGTTWSSQTNQPTAELYHLTVDDAFPYRVYSAQQDYGTISLPSRVFTAGGITLQHWMQVGGGEIGPVALDPRNPDIIYAGGFLSRMDRKTGQIRRIMHYPQYWMGVPSSKLHFRVPSDAPVLVSAHDPGVLYSTSQFVHRSRDGGQNWELISPDLTRNDPSKLIASGGPLTHDITSIETYCTIVALAESPLDAGMLWVGSDDGLVHLSRDGGKTWLNVTPAGMPAWGRVNAIDASVHAPGRATIAVTRYMLDDFHPYVFSTDDYGAHWRMISAGNGIPADHFVRVVREDPRRRGLFYAGTEFGLYISFNDGGVWQPFQLNLPVTPISDLLLHHDDLVVATQGRGFWLLDDVTLLHQLGDLGSTKSPRLFRPRDTYRIEGGWRKPGAYMSQDDFHGGLIETDRIGENPPPGAMIFYYLPAAWQRSQEVTLSILDDAGKLVRSYSSAVKDQLPVISGMNRLVWDLSYPDADIIPGSRLDGSSAGPRALPGKYSVRLEVGKWSQTQDLQVLSDPRSKATAADLHEQFEFLLQVRDKLSQTHAAVRRIRALRAEIDAAEVRRDGTVGAGARAEAERAVRAELDDLEDHLRQKRSTVWQDTENFETLLDDQFAWLAAYTQSADTRPTSSARARFRDLDQQLAALLARLGKVAGEILDLERKTK